MPLTGDIAVFHVLLLHYVLAFYVIYKVIYKVTGLTPMLIHFLNEPKLSLRSTG